MIRVREVEGWSVCRKAEHLKKLSEVRGLGRFALMPEDGAEISELVTWRDTDNDKWWLSVLEVSHAMYRDDPERWAMAMVATVREVVGPPVDKRLAAGMQWLGAGYGRGYRWDVVGGVRDALEDARSLRDRERAGTAERMAADDAVHCARVVTWMVEAVVVAMRFYDEKKIPAAMARRAQMEKDGVGSADMVVEHLLLYAEVLDVGRAHAVQESIRELLVRGWEMREG